MITGINLIQLPPRDSIRDVDKWLEHIQSQNGFAFLPYFAMAPQIEAQNSGKAPENLKEAKDMAARCYYKRASENTELAKLCKEYNIPEDGDECSFNTCLDYLKSLPKKLPMKDSDNLPHPVIIGSGAAEGYCWVKLPTDDVRALILGVMTGCCQSIGGHSEQCVKDAITLPNNGLYVLLKRKDRASQSSQPHTGTGNSINYTDFKIVGQSYGWISATGNLTLDSLECSRDRVTSSETKALLTQFAETVLAENASIKRITLGVGGGTPRDIGFSRALIPEKMRSGYQYGDSRNQYCIAKRANKIPDDQFDTLWKHWMIQFKLEFILALTFKDTLRYLSDYLSDTSHFQEELSKLWSEFPALARELTPDTLFRYLSLTTTPTLNDLYPVDLDALSTKELSQISTARLVWREMTPEQLLKVFAYVPKEEHLRILQAHKGILHRATHNPELLRVLLALYRSPEESLAAIKEKGRLGQTVLYHAAGNHESLNKLLALYRSPEDQMAAIKEKNDIGRTILHNAAHDPESLKILLALYRSPEDRLAAFKDKDNWGVTVLYWAVEKHESLRALLEMIPESELLAAIKEKDNDGNTVLYYATDKPELLKAVLTMLPEESLKELPKEILELPFVKQFIQQKSSQSTLIALGIFKPQDSDGTDGPAPPTPANPPKKP